MLQLLFYLSGKPYTIDASRVLEVLPAVPLRSIPGTPEYVAGSLQYRGRDLPVIDLTQLIIAIPSAKKMSTRIIVIDASSGSKQNRALGLICEGVTDTVDRTHQPSQTQDQDQTEDIESVLPQSMYDFLFDLARS